MQSPKLGMLSKVRIASFNFKQGYFTCKIQFLFEYMESVTMDFLIYFVIIMVGPLLIHFYLKKTYSKHLKMSNSSGLTGYEVARKILDENNLQHVKIEITKGKLSDHYQPSEKVVRLSEDNYYGTSIAAQSVAAHEVGHAIQHAGAYHFLTIRHKLFPIANIGSNFSFVLIIAGILLSMSNLLLLGIIAMSFAVLFQIVTLPVEFDASSRAKDQMVSIGLMKQNTEEENGVSKVLNAAALTYVAATAVAVAELLRFVLIYISND